jgi:phage terminase Nu1 subunit (DNA packaging protein)
MTHTRVAPARVKRNGRGQSSATLVNGSKLAAHFAVTRQFVDQLTQQGIIERLPSGLYDQDRARWKYLDHLRSQHRRSPRAEADGELARARAEWLRLRTAERLKELVPAELMDRAIDELAGTTLVALSGVPMRLFPYAADLAQRKRCEAVIFQVRQELAAKASRRAGELEVALAGAE